MLRSVDVIDLEVAVSGAPSSRGGVTGRIAHACRLIGVSASVARRCTPPGVVDTDGSGAQVAGADGHEVGNVPA